MVACILWFSCCILPRLHGATPVPQDTSGPNIFSFTSPDYYVLEDATNAWISVRMEPGNRGWSGAIDYSSLDGTAVAPADYGAVRGVLGITRFGVNAFAVSIVLDSEIEGEETVQLRLSPYVSSTVSRSNATLHILDAEGGRVSFRENTNSVRDSSGPVSIALIRTRAQGSLVVHYRTGARYEGTTAIEGVDFTPLNGTLVFADGETSKTILLPVFDDNTNGRSRTVRLVLSDDVGHARIGNGVMDIGIEDDLPPRLLITQSREQGLVLYWSASCADYVVERASCPSATGWETLATAYTIQNGACVLAEPIADLSSVYRLRKKR